MIWCHSFWSDDVIQNSRWDLGPLLPTRFDFNHSVDELIITLIIMCEMKLLIRSQTWNYCDRWYLGMDDWFHPTFYTACEYLSMLGSKLNHVSKRDPFGNCGTSSVKLSDHDSVASLKRRHHRRRLWERDVALIVSIVILCKVGTPPCTCVI